MESQSSGVCFASDLSQGHCDSVGLTQDPGASECHAQGDAVQKHTCGPRSALSLLAAAGTHLLGVCHFLVVQTYAPAHPYERVK